MVGGALAIADQLEKSGLARLIADWLMGSSTVPAPWWRLSGSISSPLILTELMSNNAAAAPGLPHGLPAGAQAWTFPPCRSFWRGAVRARAPVSIMPSRLPEPTSWSMPQATARCRTTSGWPCRSPGLPAWGDRHGCPCCFLL